MIKELISKYAGALKKLAAAIVGGVIAYLVLGYIVPGILDLRFIPLVGGVVIAYLVYTRVALWEIKRAVKLAADAAKAAVGEVKKI